MKKVTLPDVLVVAGGALFAGGIAAYDWRVALIVCGLLLLIGGVFAIVRGK